MLADNGDQGRSGAKGGGQEAAVGRRFRLSLALPLGQLLLCAALILLVCGPGSLMPGSAGTIYVEADATATNHDGPRGDGKSALEKDNSTRRGRAEEASDRRMGIEGRVLSSVWLLNVPAGFLQMEAARYASIHQGWMARVVDAFISSLLSSSLLALPFWWIAGRGADALLAMRRKVAAPRIRFAEAAIAFVLFVGAGLLAVGGLVAFVVGQDKPASPLITVFLLMWCFLGAIPMRARYQQRRKLAVGN